MREIKMSIPQTYDKKIQKVLENSIDLTFVSEKGHGKTVAVENLAKKIIENPKNRLICFESFPKWCMEFPINFMEIPQKWIIQTDKTIDLENTWIRHEKSYRLLNEDLINQFLRENHNCTFLINSDDIESIAYFIYSIVYKFYRKRYDLLRKGYPITENVYFILEEAQNSLSSFVLSKSLFNRYRKLYSEARNMNLRWILITQRLQDLSTYFRCRTSLAIGKISLDDWDLKLKRMLSPIGCGKEILEMPIGSFYFSCVNEVVQFPKWQKIKGKEWIPKIPEKSQPKAKKKSLLRRIWDFIPPRKSDIVINGKPQEDTEPKHDTTYGENTFDQEDDEFHEEVF
jgi:hypothetical protein